MKRIGLLSDTHGDVPEGLRSFFEKCDEIWHAGDIGLDATLLELTGNRMLRAVFGNIDGTENRIKYPEKLRFFCENTEVFIIHIGGYPGNYERSIRQEINVRPPKLFICGHSHILKVIYDKKLELLHLNPGAAGIYGWHKFSTAMRFIIEGSDIKELEIWQVERGRRDEGTLG